MIFIYRILEIYVVKWGINRINMFRACLVLFGALSVPWTKKRRNIYIIIYVQTITQCLVRME